MAKKKNDGVIKQWNSISTFGIVGNVIENNLKLDKEKKIDTITGSITIKFGDNSTDVVTVGAWQPEFFGTGTENQSFTKTLEAMETLVTLSQATPENPASVVIINNNDKDFAPKIDIDKYWDVKKGEFNEMTKAKLGMFTAIEINNSIKPEEFGSEFTVNIAVIGEPYVDEDSETLMIDGATVDYKGGVHTMTLAITNEETAEGLEDVKGFESIEQLQEICDEFADDEDIPFDDLALLELWGYFSLASITVSKTKKSKFGGKGKKTSEKIFTSSFNVEGAEVSETFKPYELLNALNNKEEYEDTLKQEAEDRASKKSTMGNKTKGFSNSRLTSKKDNKKATRGKF